MLIIKSIRHIYAILDKFLFFIIYGNSLVIGKNTTWRCGFRIMKSKTAKINIGRECFFNNDCTIDCTREIVIGEGSIFGENVKIYDHNHRFADPNISIKEQGFSDGVVKIGKHCWIGSNVVILKGANIGDNCVIGAGCVVSETIPSGHIISVKPDYNIEKIHV